MVAPSLSETQPKDVLKAALIEVLEERSDLLRDVLAEVMEDVALVRAIQVGESNGARLTRRGVPRPNRGRVKTAFTSSFLRDVRKLPTMPFGSRFAKPSSWSKPRWTSVQCPI